MTIAAAIALYLKSLAAKDYAARTVDTYGPHLATFRVWADEHQITDCRDIDVEILRAYQGDVATRVSQYNRPLSLSTQAALLGVVKGFCAFLAARNVLLMNPALNLELPRTRRHGLPHGLPTPAEVARIIEVPDTRTATGLRDRAVLEVLYSTAIRSAELRALRVYDVDLGEGTLTIFHGKGRKDRVVPLSRKARYWLEAYLTRVRPLWARAKTAPILFLTTCGNPINGRNLNTMLKKAARKARVNKRVTAHTYRHACASHMLKNGADIRYIQKLLGHRSLLSTQIYTHLEIQDLKRIHRKCHPRAKPPTLVADKRDED